MDKKFQLYLYNNSGGPFKIPFKRGTPSELQAMVNGVIPTGKKAIIPSEISEFVDISVLDNFANRSLIKYKIREVSAIPSKVEKPKKVVKAVKVKEGKAEKGKKGGIVNG